MEYFSLEIQNSLSIRTLIMEVICLRDIQQVEFLLLVEVLFVFYAQTDGVCAAPVYLRYTLILWHIALNELNMIALNLNVMIISKLKGTVFSVTNILRGLLLHEKWFFLLQAPFNFTLSFTKYTYY